MQVVGLDSTHFGGGEEYVLGTFGGEKLVDCHLIGEVELGVSAGNDVVVALTAQLPYNGGSDHATMAGHVYL